MAVEVVDAAEVAGTDGAPAVTVVAVVAVDAAVDPETEGAGGVAAEAADGVETAALVTSGRL
jgi:hypothetical protein